MSGILDVSVQLLGQLANLSLRWLALALIAVAAIPFVRSRSSAARHAIWTVVLAGMLALPVLGPLLPSMAVSMPQWIPATSFQAGDIAVTPGAKRFTSAAALANRPPQPARPFWPVPLASLYLA